MAKWISNLIGTKLNEFRVKLAKLDSSNVSTAKTFLLPNLAGTLGLRPDAVTLSDASTVTVDATTGATDFFLSTASSRTLGAPGAGYDGQKIVIAWKNTSGGNVTTSLTTGSNGFRFLGSATGLAPTAAGTTEYIICRYHATDSRWDVIGYSGDLIKTIGYNVFVQALTSSPADGATTYFGNMPKAPTSSAAQSKVYFRKAGLLKRAEIYCYSGTAGTSENWSLYVRLNNTTDYLIATVGAGASERVFSNTALNTTGIAIAVNDYIEIKMVNPTWTTNPLTSIFGGHLYFEESV